MIIKEIVIQNFRSYYGTTTIKFKDGLTLFIGDNGDGKTTFYEALEWLFDTSTENKNANLISEKRISEISEFNIDRVLVSMTFEHDGEKAIEKSFIFSKDIESNIQTSDFQFKGFSVEGFERIPEHGGRLLDRCFDAAIRKYCLFKGEHNLDVFKNPDALKYLIETFSDISQFSPYIDFATFAEEESDKVYKNAMKNDRKNSEKEKKLRIQIESLKRDLGTKTREYSNNKANENSYANRLNDIEQSKEASSLLKDLNNRLKSLKEKKAQNLAHINENYSTKLLDEQWILSGFTTIFDEFQSKVSELSREKRKLENEFLKENCKNETLKELASGIIPLPPYIPDAKTMDEMILDEYCKVCGREAKKGSEPYNFMVKKLSDLLESQNCSSIDSDKPVFPNNYIKELEQMSIQLGYNIEELYNLNKKITEEVQFNTKRKEEDIRYQQLIDIEEDNKRKLLSQNDNLTEDQLLNAYENITNWWQIKEDAGKKALLLEKEIKSMEENLKLLQSEYDNLAKDSIANMYCKIHTALDKVKKAFNYAKEKNTHDFLSLLEEKSNQYLEKLNIDGFYGIIRIISDSDGKNAKIKLLDTRNTYISSPNQALKTTMYMSVLFAVSELTALKRENDYPLIFDAPTSSFTDSKETDFFNVISEINKQSIIFTKSFLQEDKENNRSILNLDSINLIHGKIFRLDKKRPFNKLDLSTIETTITPIN